MTTPAGFFHLRTPVDLLKKMEFHLEQLSADPLNEYAAFDFFVAAAHLPEWLGKSQCAPGQGDVRAQALRRVCNHLANGAKHFTANASHNAVRGMAIATPARSGIARSGITISGNLLRKPLILLAADEAAALGVEAISTLSLGQMVLTYWREHEAVKRAAAKALTTVQKHVDHLSVGQQHLAVAFRGGPFQTPIQFFPPLAMFLLPTLRNANVLI